MVEKRERPGVTTIELGEERLEALKREAGRRQAESGEIVTVSALVREAVDQLLARKPGRRR